MLARLLAQVHALLFPLRADEAIVATLASETLLSLLDPELVPLGDGLSAATLLPFIDERVRAVIHEAKYQGNRRAFALLAAVLAEYLREALADTYETRSGLVLVPVPLGEARRKERGYNQVEEVAKLVATELGIPVEANLLIRTRETLSQVSLPRRKRLQNMRNALSLAKGKATTNTITYILLDDVLTTGATLLAASTALIESGAENVLAVALAH